MTTQANNTEVITPSLPKGGGAIQSIGTGWGAVGMTGQASFDVPLPLSPGRTFTPALSLSYRSTLGNGPFGIGWDLSAGAIVRNTLKGVPTYTDKDEFISHTGSELIPERTAQGALNTTTVSHYNGVQLRAAHTVVRYLPRVESTFERIEHWSTTEDPAGFWLVQSPDGSTHLFGKTTAGRCADPAAPEHVAQWLLQESLTAHGEQIYYHYKSAEQHSSQPAIRDFRAQRYLARVCYANLRAQTQLMLWTTDTPADKQWHFELVLDYGERTYRRLEKPGYAELRPWQPRKDPFFSYAYGFELGNQYLCRQVLMFHYFPDEAAMGPDPVLVRRLLLQYRWTEGAGNLLRALLSQAFDAGEAPAQWPPMVLTYSPFTLEAAPEKFQPFEALNVPGNAAGYQLVDLYNDGLPGVLSRAEKSWYYREPTRAPLPAEGDAVDYGETQLLANIPVADQNQTAVQTLSDLNGDGQLDWILARPGMSGFFTLKGDRSWSGFVPFAAFPQEFFHPASQWVDLMGNGIYDLALIGSHSVRIYINQGTEGFAAGQVIPHIPAETALPQPGSTATELVAFSDILGSGQQHLIRIRHDHIQCWPNLGGGHFGKGFEFASLPFSYASFDPARILLADLDGSGASDLLYLEPDKVLIFMSRFGHGLQPPVPLKWPDGVRYDRFCQVTTADLQGLGCSSLVMTTSQGTTRHWRYDFVSQKPYLLTATENNMGARGELNYRSSAQEWLDEKRERQQANKPQVSGLPFPLHLVTRQQQFDLISGNQIAQRFQYREGFYDPRERKFQGFGLLFETDAQTSPDDTLDAGHTGALLRKSWFHTGKDLDMPRSDYNQSDKSAKTLGLTLLGRLEPGNLHDTLIQAPSATVLRAMKKALSGSPLREEIYAADDPAATAVPYSVSQQRYLVRQLESTDSVLLLPLESVSYRYEREPDDPACSHTLNLIRDAYGSLVHGMTVNCARRKRATDAPPFSDPHQQKWWRDTHDAAQQADYITEIRAQAIHLDAPQRWRLELPYRQRSNALVLDKGTLGHISYEHFIARTPNNPVGVNAGWVLAGASVQHYCLAQSADPLPAGQASFEALPHHVESAELDEPALAVYDDVPQMPGAEPFDLEKELPRAHYHPMTLFLPAPEPSVPEQNAKTTLWSLKQGFAVYDDAAEFYRANYFRATECHGVTVVAHDRYKYLMSSVKTADGCTTTAVYDYRTLMPIQITDAQGTVQQARYNAFGQLLATSFYGHEEGKAVGFETLDNYVRPANDTPETAIANPASALMKAASACFYAPFSWMQKREPVHVAVLQADRYPTDTDGVEPIIRISVASSDGSGRVLQNKQKTVPGPAYQVDPGGVLRLDATGKPLTLESNQRWRVSARVEYNNKGLAIRNYRPYFADHWHSINDASLREGGYSDQLFYDPLGRLTKTLNASGDMSRQTYCTWYTISEDENDTYEPPPTAP
ncbi:SpvB/TcaC N-terminal domain-containing protein [Pseudomonas sp. CCC3.1]|uniref:SpvB/TcaC N-terminal domain-containing protein n=1 Tax=Pseudomonas sp. CCC3.1 TaxID=3048607 RepID=UPI002AC9D16B|nr:SpvB/TcaC N-terminal domain-containing protein [Pseudomonas sp. CCC3.1]MEB0206600.1 SpvB/TcaC N-terminal domain-containing protein [Pseudomonas sp. CCC3.1]WPX34269.1 SpvB/TcaC N-terminal domain-containing protein [Pseudomonas sp. CCC3.1]